MSVSALLSLANHSVKDDLSGYESLPEDIAAALQEQLADEKKAAAKSAAKQIVGLMKNADIHIESQVKFIRDLRDSVRSIKTSLANLDRAKKYALKTNNWIPLAIMLRDIPRHELNTIPEDLKKVPDSFVVEEVATAE